MLALGRRLAEQAYARLPTQDLKLGQDIRPEALTPEKRLREHPGSSW